LRDVLALAALLILATIAPARPMAQSATVATLTSPRQQFGHDIGDDYFLANYTQFAGYL